MLAKEVRCVCDLQPRLKGRLGWGKISKEIRNLETDWKNLQVVGSRTKEKCKGQLREEDNQNLPQRKGRNRKRKEGRVLE